MGETNILDRIVAVKRDEAASPGAKIDVVSALPRSVDSGRTIEEIGPSFHRKIRGGAAESKTMVLEALDNVDGTPREIVLLNAGAALYAANLVPSLAEGVRRARSAIADGSARAKLDQYIAYATRQARG